MNDLATTTATTPSKRGVISVDIEGNLPSLADATALPISLNFSYWTPDEKGGETKRVYFLEVRAEKVQSINSQETIDLECAIFIEQLADGSIQQIGNGSKRLVGPLMNAVDNGLVKQGTPLEIKHLGKKKNKSNSFFSDDWSIKPLIINI